MIPAIHYGLVLGDPQKADASSSPAEKRAMLERRLKEKIQRHRKVECGHRKTSYPEAEPR